MSGLYGGSKEFAGGPQAQSTSASASNGAVPNETKLEFHADADPLRAGGDSPFRVSLTDAKGKPIADAQVTVTFMMPAMPSMNMPEVKNAFGLQWMAGQQMYMGNGQAQTAGSWMVLVEARRNGSVIASYRTHLNAR
jgi:hypothetical protein